MKRCLIGLFVIAGLFVNSFAQNMQAIQDMVNRSTCKPEQSDVRSLGMGKSSVASSYGSSALYNNPSLIASLTNTSFMVEGGIRFGIINYDYFDDMKKYKNFSTYEHTMPVSGSFNNFSIAMPVILENTAIPVSLGVALGYNQPYNLSSIYKAYTEDTLQIKIDSIQKIRGGMRSLTGGFALGIFNKLYVGYSYSNSSFSRLIIDNIAIKNEKDIRYKYTYYSDFSFSQIGLAVKPLKNMTIGIKVRTPIEWKFGNERVLIENSPYLPHDTVYTIPVYQKITFPTQFSLGVNYQIVPRFGITTEIQTRNFEYIEITFEDGQFFYSGDYIRNGIFYSLGLEAIAGIVPLRAGFFLEALPIRDASADQTSKDIKDNIYSIGATFGAGIKIKDVVNLDFGLVWDIFKQERRLRNPTGSVSTFKDYTLVENHFRVDLGITVNIPCPTFKTKDETTNTQADTTSPAPPVVTPAPIPEPIPAPAPVFIKPSIGDMVLIKTYDGMEYRGQLVEETMDMYVIVDVVGTRNTYQKSSVNTITKQ